MPKSDGMSPSDQARSIINKYFHDGGSHFISLDSLRQNPSLEENNECIVSADFFNDAKVSLKNHMENELLPKFKQTDEFGIFLKRMRTYDEIDVKLLA